MMRGGIQRLVALFVMSAALVALAATEPVCVVCGEPTEGGYAVVHSNQAYAIHAYPCKSTWDRAVAAGRLDGVAGPIPPADALFSVPPDPPTAFFPGNPIVWAAFLLGAMTMSGLLALLFGTALQRRPLAAFALGFCIPAVGMVLVPVLPAKQGKSSEQETS